MPATQSPGERDAKAAALRSAMRGVMLKRRRKRWGLPAADETWDVVRMAQGLHSGGEGCCEVASAVRAVQAMLSREYNPPIGALLGAVPPVVPRLLQIASRGSGEVQSRALWALTNIAAGTSEQTEVVVQAGAIPVLVSLLQQRASDSVFEHAIWCLGNICGDSARLRDTALDAGALDPLLSLLDGGTDCVEVRRTVASTLASLVRGTPTVRADAARDAVPMLAQLASSKDSGVASDAMWGLSSVSNCTEYIQMVADTGVLPCLVQRLQEGVSIHSAAATVLGSVMAGSTEQSQAVLDAGAVAGLCALMSSSRNGVVRVCLTALGNAAAGTPSQVQHLIDSGAIGVLLGKLREGRSRAVSEDALWALANAVEAGTGAQRAEFVKEGFIPAFVTDLVNERVSKKAAEVGLNSLRILLEHGSSAQAETNPCVSAAVEAGINEMLQCLQDSTYANELTSLAAVMEMC